MIWFCENKALEISAWVASETNSSFTSAAWIKALIIAYSRAQVTDLSSSLLRTLISITFSYECDAHVSIRAREQQHCLPFLVHLETREW